MCTYWHERQRRRWYLRWQTQQGNRAAEQPHGDKSKDAPSALVRVLLTWNINTTSAQPEDRMPEVLISITRLGIKVDIIFLQEAPRPTLQQALKHRRNERALRPAMSGPALSPPSRVTYPSRFNGDELCCDIFVSLPIEPHSIPHILLVSVHLNLLPIQPSRRPQQLSVSHPSSAVRATGWLPVTSSLQRCPR